MINNNLRLLDCTLRDGGFINDWNFGWLSIRSIVSRLDSAGIDIIEIGFLDDSVTYDKHRSIFPDIQSVSKTLGKILPKRAELTAMIDFGHFSKEALIPRKDSVIDGIRLIFKKNDVKEALEYAAAIKQNGYKLFINPVSITSYQDAEILELVSAINKIGPEAVSIVDTYGLMFTGDILRYVYLFDGNLDAKIALGYHSHNNLQMAFANCIEFAKRDIKRGIIVDSSVFGMGKSAGNACTELFASYLIKNGAKQLDINHILECAHNDINRFQEKQTWGYALEFLISAINECSPNWPKYYLKKHKLSIKDICSIISELPPEKRQITFYSNELAERKYVEFMDKAINDGDCRSRLSDIARNRKLLVLCPGGSLLTRQDKIKAYIKENDPLVFSINFVSDDIVCDYAFFSNSVRYSQMSAIYSELAVQPKVIITSNIVPTDFMPPDMTFNYGTLYEEANGDNSAVLALLLLHSIGARSFAVAGFDGYSATNDYFDDEMRFDASPQINDDEIIKQLQNLYAKGDIKLNWITPSSLNCEIDNV